MSDKYNLINVMNEAETELKKGSDFFNEMVTYMNNFINILDGINSVTSNFSKFDAAVRSVEGFIKILSVFPTI